MNTGHHWWAYKTCLEELNTYNPNNEVVIASAELRYLVSDNAAVNKQEDVNRSFGNIKEQRVLSHKNVTIKYIPDGS